MRILSAILALTACSPATERPEAPPAAAASAADVATVSAPIADARVTNPLIVTGVAPANWYFENQFPVRLVDAQGAIIAEAPATPRVNWTANAEPKEFDASLAFSVSQDTPATLILQEDMPGEGETPREVRVPVVLSPAH